MTDLINIRKSFKNGSRKGNLKQAIPIALAISLALTQLTGCVGPERQVDGNQVAFLNNQDILEMLGVPNPFAEIEIDAVFNGDGVKFYNQLINNEIDGARQDLVDFYSSIAGDGASRKNVSITFFPVNTESDWTHSLVFTADDVMLYSENSENKLSYITGLCDGEMYNDLGLISDGRMALIEEAIKTNGYNAEMINSKKALVGLLSKLEIEGLIGLSAGKSEVYSYDGTLSAYAQTLMPIENNFKDAEDSLTTIY